MEEQTNKPWQAENIVTAELATLLISQQFPKLTVDTILPMGAGWDNTAYLVNQNLVFRFPRRQIAVDLMTHESRVLTQIAHRLPLPVPLPIYIGQASTHFPWPFSGYTLLPGQTACEAALSANERVAAAKPLAEFLKALHSITPPKEAPADTLGRADPKLRWGRTLAQLNKINTLQIFANMKPLFRQLEELKDLQELELSPNQNVLCHGDLYARHILIATNRTPCGIIDWGDVHIGNRAVDLSLAFAFLPPAGREIFFEYYGTVDRLTLRLAQLRALFSLATLLVFSHDIKEEALFNEAHWSLGMIK
ncbi:MAG: phosphotransferase [Myxococcota bacterium]